jgi:hypothetical protein
MTEGVEVRAENFIVVPTDYIDRRHLIYYRATELESRVASSLSSYLPSQ